MSKTAVIQARIDPKLKEQAQKVLKTLNISMSEAISLYLTQVTLHQGIPFEIRIPNKTSAAALKDAEERKASKRVDTADDLFRELAH